MITDDLCRRLGIRLPIIQAPMANGLSTPELVAAVGEAGGLGSLAHAYDDAATITRSAEAVRQRSQKPFAINLFIPLALKPADAAAAERARPILNGFRRELGLEADPPVPAPRDDFDAQFEAMLRARPAVFSFTMGVLDAERLRALRDAGTITIGTATTPDEAVALADSGVDIVCAQGCEAGGHRGSFLAPTEESLWSLDALVPQIVRRVRLPVLAAGGIVDGRGIAAALALGAHGVQIGTAFLACPEAGTAPTYRAALASDAARDTVLTKAFSGRQGRAIRNRYTDALAGTELPPFPGFLGHTRDVRGAAAKQGRTDLMQLWSGQGAPLTRALPAAELMATLVRETREAIADLGRASWL